MSLVPLIVCNIMSSSVKVLFKKCLASLHHYMLLIVTDDIGLLIFITLFLSYLVARSGSVISVAARILLETSFRSLLSFARLL